MLWARWYARFAFSSFSLSLPETLAPRSGLAVKHFIDVGAGVIDSDYRGNVGVVLFNHGDQDFKGFTYLFLFYLFSYSLFLRAVLRGDRIAQLILEQIFVANVVECAELDVTVRGGDGFGSTGTRDSDGKNAPAKRKHDE